MLLWTMILKFRKQMVILTITQRQEMKYIFGRIRLGGSLSVWFLVRCSCAWLWIFLTKEVRGTMSCVMLHLKYLPPARWKLCPLHRRSSPSTGQPFQRARPVRSPSWGSTWATAYLPSGHSTLNQKQAPDFRPANKRAGWQPVRWGAVVLQPWCPVKLWTIQITTKWTHDFSTKWVYKWQDRNEVTIV